MDLYIREKYLKKIRGFYNDTEIIKVITGIRRCGKSCLMQTIKNELFNSGVNKDNLIMIDLDDLKFRKIKTADALENLIISSTKSDGINFLFIDEIQNVSGFEEVINGFRGRGNYSIFITGSNSYLLSGELVTKLTGRYIEFEIFPLTFDEYIDMKKFYNKPISTNLSKELVNYIQEGGFPKTLQYETFVDKRTYCSSIIKEIFSKDIKKRIKICNIESFNCVRDFIINNFASTFSIKSLHETLLKNNIKVKRQTLSRYIEILSDSKIIYPCDRFDIKSKKSLSGEKKYFLADTSFYFANNTDDRINYGPTLENIVFVYAKSLGYSISIGRIGKLECDFILRDEELNYSYVQVAYTINSSRTTEDREYAPLEIIKDNYPKYVMTIDDLLQKRKGIKHINLIDFISNHNLF